MRRIVWFIMLAIGLFMVGVALLVQHHTVARIAAEQTDFDNYIFIMPDGSTFNTKDLQVDDPGILV